MSEIRENTNHYTLFEEYPCQHKSAKENHLHTFHQGLVLRIYKYIRPIIPINNNFLYIHNLFTRKKIHRTANEKEDRRKALDAWSQPGVSSHTGQCSRLGLRFCPFQHPVHTRIQSCIGS